MEVLGAGVGVGVGVGVGRFQSVIQPPLDWFITGIELSDLMVMSVWTRSSRSLMTCSMLFMLSDAW